MTENWNEDPNLFWLNFETNFRAIADIFTKTKPLAWSCLTKNDTMT